VDKESEFLNWLILQEAGNLSTFLVIENKDCAALLPLVNILSGK
jgi:hypothetical protein